MNWRDDALCAQVDTAIFFPPKGGSTKPAKRVCSLCPALDVCREYAVTRDERFGIWGGLSERQRTAERRQRGLPPVCQMCREVAVSGGVYYCRGCASPDTIRLRAQRAAA
jgi:hypothetical protein